MMSPRWGFDSCRIVATKLRTLQMITPRWGENHKDGYDC